MNEQPAHWYCPDCGEECRCTDSRMPHVSCGMTRLVPQVGPIPKPVAKPKPKRRTWAPGLYEYIVRRDGGCKAHRLGLGLDRVCFGRVEIDHVRPSGALGMKSPSEAWNLISLCGQHHYMKTVHQPYDWRPVLIDHLNEIEGHSDADA